VDYKPVPSSAAWRKGRGVPKKKGAEKGQNEARGKRKTKKKM